VNSRFAIALAAALLVFAACRRPEPPAPPPAIRLALPVPAGIEPGFAEETLDAAISPDESELVFVATSREPGPGARRLWRRTLRGDRAEPLAGTEGAQQPAWKWTGNVVSFFADGRLKQLTLGDGVVHDLADAPSAAGAAWLPDGSLLFATGTGPIRRMKDGQSTDATTLAPGDLTHQFPVAAELSGEFVYIAVRDDGRRLIRLAGAGNERDLMTTSGHAAIMANRLLHVRDGTLLAYERDPETGSLAPRGAPVGLDVGVSTGGRALFAASRHLLVHAPAAPRASEVVWLDASGARAATAADAGDYWQVRLSPDDRAIALTVMDPLLHALDISTFPADGSAPVRRLTLALAAETDPVWSPDARRVLFRSMEGGTADLFARDAAQKEQDSEVILRSEMEETPTDWQGDRILFQARGGGSSFDVMVLHGAGGRYETVAGTPFNETDARWSPDGRWIVYVSDESGRPDIYARRPDGTRVRVSFAGGRRPRWSGDGRAIVFLRGSQLMRADMTTADAGGFSPARVLFDAPGIRDFDVAHRSDRLIALLSVEAGERPTVSAVWNWTSVAEPSSK
jgi:dipeptidyl aminopeptidase/acylaminoacyl peptidase